MRESLSVFQQRMADVQIAEGSPDLNYTQQLLLLKTPGTYPLNNGSLPDQYISSAYMLPMFIATQELYLHIPMLRYYYVV